jgi:hypothetical protein
MLLRTHNDLTAFRRAYLRMFSRIEKDYQPLERIHLFPAVPLPVAVLCGHDVLNKAHPALEVYDLQKGRGGLVHQLTLDEAQERVIDQ